MALDFPNSPVDGQVYDNFIYDATKGTWKSLSSGASPNYLVNPTITNAVITATADTPSTIPLTINGAASQSANLQEWKDSAGIALADIDSTGKANFKTGANAINIKASSGVNHGYMSFYTENTTPSTRTGYFGFGSNGTETMTIANERSSGVISLNSSYVRIPNQPLFSAYNPEGQYITGNAVAAFNSTWINQGGHYNTSNGRFTVPIAGNYRFTLDGLFDNTTAHHASIRVNGVQRSGSELYTDGNNQWLSKSIIYSLSANDYVDVFVDYASSRIHQRYGSFTGELIS